MPTIRLGPTARAISLMAIGAAIVAADVRFQQHNVSPTGRFDAGTASAEDALARELTRCQRIGMAARDDAACQAAWAENHRRFFAPLVDHPHAAKLSPNVMQPR